MKKIISILLASLLIVALAAGCSTTSSSAGSGQSIEGKTIGILWCYIAAPSISSAISVVDPMAEELGVKLVHLDSMLDPQKESDNALSLISQKVDGIIANPGDAVAFEPTAKIIQEAGIPVVVVAQAMDPSTEDLWISYVGTNDLTVGRAAGDAMVKLLAQGGNVVVVEGAVGSTPQLERSQGFEEKVNAAGNIPILDRQETGWDRANAVSVTENFLAKYNNIDAIFAHDDNLAIGVVEALRSAGLDGKIPVIGVGGDPEVFEYIKSGDITETFVLSIKEDSRTCLRIFQDYFEGKTVEKYNYNTPVSVTIENVDTAEPAY